MIILAVLVCFGGVARSESEPAEKLGYIGIRMDAQPLPELLVKHLRLGESQGVRIQNVGVGTPADTAGLERDDIIMALDGNDITDSNEFARAVQKAGVGTDVSLDIIHLGERKTVKLKLTSFDKIADFEPKFPPEPEVVESWQPGRIFHMQPDAQRWIQIYPQIDPEGRVLLDANIGFGAVGNGTSGSRAHTFFNEIYTFHYSTEEAEYTVTIEGDPNDDQTEITVEAEGKSYKRRLENIEKLPEEYRQEAEQAVKKARKMAAARQYKRDLGPMLFRQPFFSFRQAQPEAFDSLFYGLDMDPNVFYKELWSNDLPKPDTELRPDTLETIQEQMLELKKRIEELEKQRGKKPENDEAETKEDAGHEHEHGEAEDAENAAREHEGAHEHGTADSHAHEGDKM